MVVTQKPLFTKFFFGSLPRRDFGCDRWPRSKNVFKNAKRFGFDICSWRYMIQMIAGLEVFKVHDHVGMINCALDIMHVKLL